MHLHPITLNLCILVLEIPILGLYIHSVDLVNANIYLARSYLYGKHALRSRYIYSKIEVSRAAIQKIQWI